ncbi:hypothetical protein [uncultured Agrobacterium sp.]|uniref:hypothetical protein n=1 Tax=uncultured Agrobacterium sp. TaxID=157277 RepID=UPI0025FCD81A|nr:hypothetical protein [uncultured Agrobacterium sp.]
MVAFSCVAHNAIFSLFETRALTDYREYELHRNSSLVGTCEFPSHLTPNFSVGSDGSFAVYGSSSAFFYQKFQNLRRIDENQEIGAIWFLSDKVIIKTESTIVERSLDQLAWIKEYSHGEIIISAMLKSDNKLILKDLDGYGFELNIRDFSIEKLD